MLNTLTMDYTGERMVPEASDGMTFWEHVERYRFALDHIQGRRVLDIACGEGYGSAAMAAAGAGKVIGVDVSEEACAHARAKYGIEAREGSAEAMPVGDGEVEVVVSFETIEHLHDVKAFLRECHRVLSPGGKIIISTPNLPVYHERAPDNPFHHHEMAKEEFDALLCEHFINVRMLGQHLPFAPIWHTQGIRRVLTWYLRVVAPQMVFPPSVETTREVIGQIRRPSSWRDDFDPYRVCAMSEPDLKRATYLIAVADRT
jgi:2-polyprenyl-3-methyl-5-hydroxy-6-metoxy-1,4-benzoquinol methylase